MDKQQAIAYIQQMLDQDHTREEIVLGLVEQLRAPEAMVAKFVAQTETEYRKSKPPSLPTPVPPQPVKLPPIFIRFSSLEFSFKSRFSNLMLTKSFFFAL